MRVFFQQIWKYRALAKALVGRHLNSRYRGTVVGFMWSFLNPLLLICTYSLVFKYYIRFEQVDNYVSFLFAGMLPWIWFTSSLNESSTSISSGGSLITKAVFPPQILPIVHVITNMINFILALPLLFLVAYFSGVKIGLSIVALPVIIFIQLLFTSGLSLAVSALNVFYRDTQHILGNFLNFWFFLCPIIYPKSVIPQEFIITYWANPMAVLVDKYQDILMYDRLVFDKGLVFAVICSVITLFIGALIFNRYRENFAEMV